MARRPSGTFNPRPTVTPGATFKRWIRVAMPSACFNPRPTVTPGATCRGGRRGTTPGLFQSSPDCYAGRNLWALLLANPVVRFNPRPTVTPGATKLYDGRRHGAQVSILARLLRRAQRQPERCQPERCRPVSILARLLRRAQRKGHCRDAKGRQVSILARLLRRAQRARSTDATPGPDGGFNPRPTVTPGATSHWLSCRPVSLSFQSSPDCYAGRNVVCVARHRRR